MEIGQKLKQKRTEQGMTQEELAQRLGITRQTVSSWENNRSYPDIGSVLKLSDLYHISLDELLKEDTAMRKHTEDSAALTIKYWNGLFELAILLTPVGNLISFFGKESSAFGILGLLLSWAGILMLPPLWIARHKLFGLDKETLKLCLTGWAALLSPNVYNLVSAFLPILNTAPLILIRAVISILSIYGMILIFQHGIFLEKGPRFWLIIFLYFAIPAFIVGSTVLSELEDSGSLSKADPFWKNYSITQADYGTLPEDLPRVKLTNQTTLILDGTEVGTFHSVTPLEEEADRYLGIWKLIPPADIDSFYLLEVSTDNLITLSYSQNDMLQWKYRLAVVPDMSVNLYLGEEHTYHGGTNVEQFVWAPAGDWENGTAQPEPIPAAHGSTVNVVFYDPVSEYPQEMTVVQELHHGDSIDRSEFTIHPDKSNMYWFPEPVTFSPDEAEQFLLYRISWENGEYLIRLEPDA